MMLYFNRLIKVFILSMFIGLFMPLQSEASQNDTRLDVIWSSISDKVIAYKGIDNPSFSTIKFKTNKPVAADLEISGKNGSMTIELSDWLNKKSEYEFSFVPRDYKKALYDEIEPLSPGIYYVSVEIVDDGYNRYSTHLGSIKVVEENKEQPLVEILDIEITNASKDLQIQPKIKFNYRVSQPAYVEVPVFRDYKNEYQRGESTQIDVLIEAYIEEPGIYEIEWDLKPPRRIFTNDRFIEFLQPDHKKLVSPNDYKIFFRSKEESIEKHATQGEFGVLNNDEEIDISVTTNNGNTEINILDGWSTKKSEEIDAENKDYDIAHDVIEGETLWKLAQKYDVSIEEIAHYNNIDINSQLTVGQKITIPTKIIEFEDVLNHWSKDSVLFLSARKIIKGVGNNKFNPDQPITRAEYMTMVLKVLNEAIEHKGTSTFIDIQSNEWYHDIVETAVELGLISGYEDHTFRPNKPITRQEMTMIAEKALHRKMPYNSSPDGEVLDIYNDKNSISPWARKSVAIATNYGLVRGKANNSFDPNGISTRAEGAVIINRLYDCLNERNK